MKLNNIDDCLNHLKSLKFDFKTHRHEPVFNMKEMSEKVPLEKAPFIKNLFYYDKKNLFYLILAKTDTNVGKQFWKALGLTPGNLRMAREDHLESVLGVYF